MRRISERTACIYENRVARWRNEKQRIALSNIQYGQLKRTALPSRLKWMSRNQPRGSQHHRETEWIAPTACGPRAAQLLTPRFAQARCQNDRGAEKKQNQP